ncbi:MAG: hypothetical protein JSS67_07895 [Bacteroidetes bacterium]|nr:hypothetical protein [Bacteroidota bacterium]
MTNTQIEKTLFENKNIQDWEDNSFFQLLNSYIQHLIQNDFPALVNLLYRIDISEKKLKDQLDNPENRDTSTTITTLIIERQIEKIKTRINYNKTDHESKEERW